MGYALTLLLSILEAFGLGKYSIEGSVDKVYTGMASSYWPGDGHCGQERADGKKFTRKDHHIAHRTLPLGSTVLVCNPWNNQCSKTKVQDRGTFGFCLKLGSTQPQCPKSYPKKVYQGCPAGYKWVVRTQRRRGECGFYRGIADLTVPVAREIGLKGIQPVVIVSFKKRKLPQPKYVFPTS